MHAASTLVYVIARLEWCEHIKEPILFSFQVMSDDDFSEVVFCSEKCRKQFGVMEPPASQQTSVTLTSQDVPASVVIDGSTNELGERKREEPQVTSKPMPMTSVLGDAEAPKPLKLSICLGQNAVTIVSGPPLTGSKSKKALKHRSADATEDEKVIFTYISLVMGFFSRIATFGCQY